MLWLIRYLVCVYFPTPLISIFRSPWCMSKHLEMPIGVHEGGRSRCLDERLPTRNAPSSHTAPALPPRNAAITYAIYAQTNTWNPSKLRRHVLPMHQENLRPPPPAAYMSANRYTRVSVCTAHNMHAASHLSYLPFSYPLRSCAMLQLNDFSMAPYHGDTLMNGGPGKHQFF